MSDTIKAAVERCAGDARQFLTDMLRFESTPGNETGVIEFCKGKFAECGCECEIVPISDELKKDPEYSHPETPLSYAGRGNLVARKGRGKGRSVILQSHVDVVPAGEWAEAFEPRVEGDTVIGRGACDAKGQVAAIWLAMKALQEMGVELAGEAQAQIVVEEEVGGNGALDLIRKGYKADAALIFEATDLNIHPANRGAIWFRIQIEGKAAHMGRKHEGISAIDLSMKVIQALYEYEARIVSDSANYPGFERYDRPVQVNVGMLHSGTWPSMVAAQAVIEGGVGFLPNRSMEQVKRELLEVIRGIDDPWLQEHVKIEFPKLHNDSYESDYAHPAVVGLKNACQESGQASEVFGWNVSCDARLYAKLAGLTTLVFGPGHFTAAHAVNESIDFREIAKAGEIVARFVSEWCG